MNTSAESPALAAAVTVVQALRDGGFSALLAGGCIRDMLLGRPAADFDVATSATPDQVVALFPRTVPVGKAFGVVQVLINTIPIEVATFRRDTGYSDGRRPDAVEFADAREDALRRDFTINGMFLDPVENKVIDFVGGREDLDARAIRTIGRPEDRFSEDYLRMLRAARFASVLEFSIEGRTASAIRLLAHNIARVSAERIQQELTRLLTESRRPGQGIRILESLGLLPVVLPEVAALGAQAQSPIHHPEGDVLTHTVNMLDLVERPPAELAYAVLLHDVGKPPTAARLEPPEGDGRIHFHGHADQGARMAEAILRRLKMPTRFVETVATCVHNHMRFMDVQKMRRSTLRRLIGEPTFPVELELHRLDCLASHGKLANYDFLKRFLQELADEPVLPTPWITGDDLLALGLPEGPDIGKWMKRAYDAQIDGRAANRETLLMWLKSELAHVNGEP